MYEIDVCGTFAAEHQLRLPDGSLEPLHAHEWRVRVTYAGAALDESGWLADFTVVRARLNGLLDAFVGRNLSTLPQFAQRNATAEHVALFLANELPAAPGGAARLKCVEVEEEAGCFARCFPV